MPIVKIMKEQRNNSKKKSKKMKGLTLWKKWPENAENG